MFGIFNERTDVDACDCTRGGCTDTVRESALKADSGRKVPGDVGLESASLLRFFFFLFFFFFFFFLGGGGRGGFFLGGRSTN